MKKSITILLMTISFSCFGQQKFFNLTQEEKKILPQLFDKSLKPLMMYRIKEERKILNELNLCVHKSITVEQFLGCEEKSRDDKKSLAIYIANKIEEDKIKLLNSKK